MPRRKTDDDQGLVLAGVRPCDEDQNPTGTIVLFPEPDYVKLTEAVAFRSVSTGRYLSVFKESSVRPYFLHAGAQNPGSGEQFILENATGGWNHIKGLNHKRYLWVRDDNWLITGDRESGGFGWAERFLIIPLGRGFNDRVAIAVKRDGEDILRFLSADPSSDPARPHVHVKLSHIGSGESFFLETL